jgi:predicted DsbA family dithiol-disulfide isomerase
MDIEIWSDIACPWCYVGKRRFEAALAAFEHRDEVSVTWRSFELDPQAPAQRPVDSATHLAEKYGMSRDEALARQRNWPRWRPATAWTCARTSRAGATPSTRTGSCNWPRPTACRTR